MKHIAYKIVISAFFAFWLALPARAAELVLFHSETCTVCEQWEEEVGTIYGKTPESQRLPLRRQSVHDTYAEDLKAIKGVVFTPTFVVLDNGKEINRFVGYMADYFFWDQITGVIAQLDATEANGVASCAGNSKSNSENGTC